MVLLTFTQKVEYPFVQRSRLEGDLKELVQHFYSTFSPTLLFYIRPTLLFHIQSNTFILHYFNTYSTFSPTLLFYIIISTLLFSISPTLLFYNYHHCRFVQVNHQKKRGWGKMRGARSLKIFHNLFSLLSGVERDNTFTSHLPNEEQTCCWKSYTKETGLMISVIDKNEI